MWNVGGIRFERRGAHIGGSGGNLLQNNLPSDSDYLQTVLGVSNSHFTFVNCLSVTADQSLKWSIVVGGQGVHNHEHDYIQNHMTKYV